MPRTYRLDKAMFGKSVLDGQHVKLIKDIEGLCHLVSSNKINEMFFRKIDAFRQSLETHFKCEEELFDLLPSDKYGYYLNQHFQGHKSAISRIDTIIYVVKNGQRTFREREIVASCLYSLVDKFMMDDDRLSAYLIDEGIDITEMEFKALESSRNGDGPVHPVASGAGSTAAAGPSHF